MRPRTAKMPKDVGVLAPRLFEGFRKYGEALRVEGAGGQVPLVVCCLREGEYGRRPQGGAERDGAEGVAEEVPQEVCMVLLRGGAGRGVGRIELPGAAGDE